MFKLQLALPSFFKKFNTSFDKINLYLHWVPQSAYYLILFLFNVILAMTSYVSINTSGEMYDYPFHLSRILSLAYSIDHGDYLPNFNYLQIEDGAYGTPMFYGNWIMYLPALIFLYTKTATVAFASYGFLIMFLGSCTAYYSLDKMTDKKWRALLAALVYPMLFPYFGYGMTAATIFVPLLIYSIYKVFFLEKYNPTLLGLVIAGLIQTHILSTLVLALMSGILVLLSYKKWTINKFISVILSAFLGLMLSMGFVFQYLEQSHSQTFFVNWQLRDFPFGTDVLLLPKNLTDAVANMFKITPIGPAFLYPITGIGLIVSLVLIKFFKHYGRILIMAAGLLILSTTHILPWEALKETFLVTFQYTERLLFFLPALVLLAVFAFGQNGLVLLLAVAQISYYVISFPLTFTKSATPYAQSFNITTSNGKIMEAADEKAMLVYENPSENHYDTSGDEYFNLDVNHDEVRSGVISNFYYDANLINISNIQFAYNSLEFDATLLAGQKVDVVLPKIWYKGYQAQYSQGASGTQPALITRALTEEEKSENKELKKPEVTEKVLHNGQAGITIESDGHVKIEYKKTILQKLGYWIEGLSFAVFFIGLIIKKNNLKSI